MKRKIFYIIGGALLFSGGVLAGKIPAVKKNTDIAHHDHLQFLKKLLLQIFI